MATENGLTAFERDLALRIATALTCISRGELVQGAMHLEAIAAGLREIQREAQTREPSNVPS